jgi:hypothetical protein
MRSPASWRVSPTDSAINFAIFAVFIWAYIEAGQWSFRASLFPRVFVALGALLCILRAIVVLRAALAGDPVAGDPVAGEGSSAPTKSETVAQLEQAVGEEDVDTAAVNSADIEYIFGQADGRMWGQALGWIGGFFTGLWFFGIFVVVPIFTVVYLMVVARMRWWSSLLYAGIAWSVLYFLFSGFLSLRLPDGVFF